MRVIPGFCVVLLMLLVGCDRGVEDVRVQQAPKLPPPPERTAMPAMTAAPGGDVHAPSAPIQWQVPQGWKQEPGSQMRFATLVVSENPRVELTVIPLAGDSGGLLANVNRWLGQIGAPAITQEDLPKVVTRLELTDGHPIDVMDLQAPETANPRQRMLAAILPHGELTWFFKLQGPHDLVTAQKPNFDAFVKTIHFGEHAPGMAAPPATAPAAAAPPAGGESATDITFTAPAGWTRDEPKPLRHVSFTISPGTEMIVSKLPAVGSGDYLGNVNRWRGQVGLPPIQQNDKQESKSVVVGGADALLFDLAGPEKRMLVAWVPKGNDWWFFKLTGPSDVIAQQQAQFDAFLKSVQFSAGEKR